MEKFMIVKSLSRSLSVSLGQSNHSRSLAGVWRFFVQYSRLNRIGQFLATVLLINSDLKVVRKLDRQGNLSLEIFDSFTGKRHFFESEQAALAWIEKRYNNTLDNFSG
jgi:hypothetical protein